MERFLYRLSVSDLRDSFLLKGALLLNIGMQMRGRATRDLGFLGRIGNAPEQVGQAVARICAQQVEDDGVEFDVSTWWSAEQSSRTCTAASE